MEPTAESTVWRLLTLIAVAEGPDSAEAAEAESIIRGGIDANRAIAGATRHVLAPALADLLTSRDLRTALPKQMVDHLHGALQWNALRTRVSVDEAVRITAAFDVAGIPVACNKGVVFQSSLYDCRDTRYFGDIDLMIRPQDVDATADLLRDLGYAAAKRYDYRSRELVDLPRADVLLYKLYPDHLPHFLRTLEDSVPQFLAVDVAYSLTWYGSQWQVPMEEVMRDLVRIPVRPGRDEQTVPALAAPYGFLFLVTHLFREAWFERTIRKVDVRLTQFADIVRFWRRLAPSELEVLRSLVEKYQLGGVVAWVCHYVDQVYDTAIMDGIGDLADYADPRWLASVGAMDGSYRSWHGDMRARLMGSVPMELAAAPEPPFGAAARGSHG